MIQLGKAIVYAKLNQCQVPAVITYKTVEKLNTPEIKIGVKESRRQYNFRAYFHPTILKFETKLIISPNIVPTVNITP
jgi:hypothetical protein